MNRKSKRTASKGETKRATKAEQKPRPEPITKPEENGAETRVNWFDVFHKLRRKKDAAAILKQEEMRMESVRYAIGTIFQRTISDRAARICEAMLGELIRAGIIQRGPQWDASLAPSMMAKSLRQQVGLNKPINQVVDDYIVEAYGVFRRPRPLGQRRADEDMAEPLTAEYYIVFRWYRHLRLERDFVLREPTTPEAKALWKDVWRMASQEPQVRQRLEDKPQRAKDFKDKARRIAKDAFHAEIKSLSLKANDS
jgi:hypothetical protein